MQWQCYNGTVFKTNGKKYGKGFIEVQLIPKTDHVQLVVTDGYKINKIKYLNVDLENAKLEAEKHLENVA
jgi:hypothetical protein